MQSLKQNAPVKNETTSDAARLAESGVRSISKEAREALKTIRAIEAARAKESSKTTDAPKAEEDAETYQRSLEPSTQAVCPRMLEAHMPLVHQVVAPIARRVPANVQRDDLLAAGLFGLVDSLRRNGGDSGITFEWYARMRIRGAVFDELRAQDWLSRRARDAVNAGANDVENESVMFVGFDELSDAEEREHLASYRLDPEAAYEAKEIMRHLAVALDKLTERERTVVAMYYYESATFKKIAEKIGVGETRAFQIHARALDRLKNVLLGKRSSRPTLREICLQPPKDMPVDEWNDNAPNTERDPEVA